MTFIIFRTQRRETTRVREDVQAIVDAYGREEALHKANKEHVKLPGMWVNLQNAGDLSGVSINLEQVRDLISDGTRQSILVNVFGPDEYEKRTDVLWEDLVYEIGTMRREIEHAHAELDSAEIKRTITQGPGTVPLTVAGRIQVLRAELSRAREEIERFQDLSN